MVVSGPWQRNENSSPSAGCQLGYGAGPGPTDDKISPLIMSFHAVQKIIRLVVRKASISLSRFGNIMRAGLMNNFEIRKLIGIFSQTFYHHAIHRAGPLAAAENKQMESR